MTNTNKTIALRHPAHGLFEVDPQVLTRAVAAHGSSSLNFVRTRAAEAAGYAEHPNAWLGVTPLDDCSLIEALIIWVESGNHTF
jgi:hypothetical protein